MADLDSLMQVPGVIGAFRFSDSGELLEHRVLDGGDLNETALDLLCHMCVANQAIATMQARGWEAMTSMEGFYPIKGFSFVGFEWTAIVEGHCGVIMPNDKVDFDAAYEALAA